jgi:cobalt-zinc-cadmium resistance protein CzcA
MVRKLIEWAVNNPLIVLCIALGLIAVGFYSYNHINVEAYPDPAPAIVELVAQWPGASAEEVERLVTVPLEVGLAGMPGLKTVHSRSLFGLSHLRCIFHYAHPYVEARQEVINRLQFVSGLPNGVAPSLSPANPIGEIYRYTLKAKKNALGEDIHTLNDLKALQDWLMEREFRRVPGIVDVTSFGGTVKRYEIQPDPERMKSYGIILAMLTNALSNSNYNIGGDFLAQGRMSKVVRSIGYIGGGFDPMVKAIGMKTAEEAAAYLRSEEQRRCNEIRNIPIIAINDKPIMVDHIVVGGPRFAQEYRKSNGDIVSPPSSEGVVVSNQTRLGRVSFDRCIDFETGSWIREDEKVQCIVLMRKGEQSMPTIHAVKAKIKELSEPGRLLPGVEILPYYDREGLVDLTTHTVQHNLFVGIGLVVMILVMFIGNIKTALIVAINMPLALLFAFSVLYLRGQSANLLSIGAVDFGIIVDSTVIMVENIYRNLASGEHEGLTLKETILKATREIDKALFFSTAIMVVAFIPLFTMQGAEGQLFGPMAQTYAASLVGALFLAMTLTPVLCMFLFKGMKPTQENFFVRFIKSRYLWQLGVCMRHPYWTCILMGCLITFTALWPLPRIGREFMPELEEGNLWVRAIFPPHVNLDAVKDPVKKFRDIVSQAEYTITDATLVSLSNTGMPADVSAKLRDLKGKKYENQDDFLVDLATRLDEKELKQFQHHVLKHSADIKYPEVRAVVVQMGRPDDGTDPGGFNNVEIFAPFREEKDWPVVTRPNGTRKRRTHHEIVEDLSAELGRKLPGIEWAFSQYIRDNVMEAITGVKGDNCVKIYGPNLEKLEELADKIKTELQMIRGIHDVGIYRVLGQANLEFVVDKEKCKRRGVLVNDVNTVVNTAIKGNALTQMVEGEKTFDITLRWPLVRRQDEASIMEIPVDVTNLTLTPGSIPSMNQTFVSGPQAGPSPTGTSNAPPASVSQFISPNTNYLPRLRLKDLVSPVDEDGRPNPGGDFTRPGGSMITREQGKRFIAVKFAVRQDRDLASAVQAVEEKTKEIVKPPYRVLFGGEFEQMEDAEGRLLFIIPMSLALIFLLLYVAFRSFLDVIVILSNVFDLAVGGIWAMYFTGTNFSVSAAVGFVSLFGVAIMEGLLMISYFNDLRAKGLPLHDAIMQGAAKRVRPVTITALTAILGLLPAAMSTAIGSQTQRPLAIVVVGGMCMTLFLDRYLMPVLYSFYGHREPPKDAASLSH